MNNDNDNDDDDNDDDDNDVDDNDDDDNDVDDNNDDDNLLWEIMPLLFELNCQLGAYNLDVFRHSFVKMVKMIKMVWMVKMVPTMLVERWPQRLLQLPRFNLLV